MIQKYPTKIEIHFHNLILNVEAPLDITNFYELIYQAFQKETERMHNAIGEDRWPSFASGASGVALEELCNQLSNGV